jgi:hypothetical protein
MASSQTISEGNGTNAATETASRTENNWKRIDDSTTAYSSSPINSTNNENSMTKYQAIKFGGTFNTLSSLTIKIDNNAPATGLSIVGAVVSAGVTPVTTASGDAAMSTTGAAANFLAGASLTYGAGTATLTASTVGYGQAVRTQLQTTSSYAGGPGDITSRTLTWTWTES